MSDERNPAAAPLRPDDGPFERLLGALALEEGTTVEAFEPDLAVLRLSSGGKRALLVRWRLETEAELPSRLRPLLARAAAAGEVDVVMVGGPKDARKALTRAAPFFTTHRIHLYHFAGEGKPWRNTVLSTGGGRVWEKLERLLQGSLPSPDWERVRRKTAQDEFTVAAEQRSLAAFAGRGERPLATYALLGLLAAFFGLEIVLGGSEDGLVLIRLGALVPDLVRAGQWWRLLSATVLHAGFMHFAFNAYVLLALGSSLERILGTRRFLVLYWASAIAGSAASVVLGGYKLSVGASGALWGLLAAEGALALRPRGLLPEVMVAVARRTAGVNLAINVLNSFRPQIDWAAHFGGGVVGAVLLLSGAITRGLPRLTEAAPEEAPLDSREPSWLSPAAALLLLLAAAGVARAVLQGRPWAGKLEGGAAAVLYEDLCAAGDAASCFRLGVLHDRGEGVEKDPARAASFFEKACERGEWAGCFNVGLAHATGDGAPKDLVRAASFYERACEGGVPGGCLNLGVLHVSGSGVARDLTRAVGLYQKACDGGELLGCHNLGLLHERGEGMPRDLARAAVFFKRACDGGESKSCGALRSIEGTPTRAR